MTTVAEKPQTPQTLLGFDLGLARTGVAVGNTLMRRAKGLATVRAGNKAARLATAQDYIKEWQPQAVIVGLPRHPDGASHEMTRVAMNFAKALHEASWLPIHLVDERYSSAIDGVETDADAAAVILQQYFDEGGTLFVPPPPKTYTSIAQTSGPT
jgi:putative holliday junction resolvase